MKKIATLAAMVALATAAHCAEPTKEEMAQLAAEMDKAVKNFPALTSDQVRMAAPVMCRDGCVIMTRAELSKTFQLMVVGLWSELSDRSKPGATYGSPAAGTHSGVNRLP